MNSAYKKDGLITRYQTNLERRIEKGDRSLVCRDEDFCKEVEMLLHSGSARKIHNLHGLDSLAVMEKSLPAFPSKTGQMRLEKLSKAFEVLELAALNLYIYPWRREYRQVKMFSGMFTHLIKPALTLQQAKELFGLLGYKASSPNEEEELALNSKLVPSEYLLSLACGFFAARMECQLLLSALGSVDRDVEWVLQLVKERQGGQSLQVALENTKRKSDPASVSEAILAGDMDAEVDLYTEQADASHMTSASGSPSHASYMTRKETDLSKPLQKDPPLSKMGNNDDARQGGPLNSPGPMKSFAEDRSESDVQRHAAANVICSCIKQDSAYILKCEQCQNVHTILCPQYKECKLRGHTLALCPYKADEIYSSQDHLRLSKEKSKDCLKQHFCMEGSTSDSFLVCYDCQLIHDHNCHFIKMCSLKHTVRPTGKLQPPQEEVNTHKRHKCLSSAHHQQHSQETSASETTCAPMSYHEHCWKSNLTLPEVLCLTCKVFHFSGCPVRWQCSQEHRIKIVDIFCISCLSHELSTLCRYCGAVYCKLCCFKNTMICKCGKPFLNPTSV
ncbi:spermatogenesis associated 2-like [Puntigrus tetrazona]|uniref:spermatogenesis associated 2-like n=1 Tax=Puntigrus tetrazona TaxID=1606681 RepID=UPI001C891C75|nr:spermatogenesis associated 2-like [Puntigrus tetrazona]XP_043119874.1 spermatogenesis associated 2-like [Puntigrus tetrazona]